MLWHWGKFLLPLLSVSLPQTGSYTGIALCSCPEPSLLPILCSYPGWSSFHPGTKQWLVSARCQNLIYVILNSLPRHFSKNVTSKKSFKPQTSPQVSYHHSSHLTVRRRRPTKVEKLACGCAVIEWDNWASLRIFMIMFCFRGIPGNTLHPTVDPEVESARTPWNALKA